MKKEAVERALEHIEWLRKELITAREEVDTLLRQRAEDRFAKRDVEDIIRRHGTVTVYCGENMEDIYQARNEYRTALEDIATSAADKETLKAVAREVLERWREKVGE